jgi:N-methylhydantoinase B
MTRYAVRRGSGGRGRNPGGDGLVREIELCGDAQVTLLADRRNLEPWGLAGGEPGDSGKAVASIHGAEENLSGKFTRELPAGSRLKIESPGGGGWGAP